MVFYEEICTVYYMYSFSALSLLLCYRYGSLKKDAVFAVLFIIVGIIRLFKKDVVLEDEGKHIFLGALFIAYAFFTVYICQAIMNLKLETMGGKRIVLNLCIIFMQGKCTCVCVRRSDAQQ